MNGFPSKAAVDRVKAMFPAGTRVELIEMDDPYRKLPAGLRGTVKSVDDIATAHILWDNGCFLGAAYGIDRIRKIEA